MKKKTLLEAVRAKCPDCGAYSSEGACYGMGTYTLYPYRFGRRPEPIRRNFTGVQRAAAAKQLAAAREARRHATDPTFH